MDRTASDAPRQSPAVRSRNVRTAAVLFSIALVFFLGVLFSRSMGGISVVMTVAGFALMAILLVVVALAARRR